MTAFLESRITGLPKRSGKVRDVYDLGDCLLIIATDRISAFDRILPTGIADKGRVLTKLSRFWFHRLDVPNHLVGNKNIPDDAILDGMKKADELPNHGRIASQDLKRAARQNIRDAENESLFDTYGFSETLKEDLNGRATIVRKARVIPFECVVRGYLDGSAWKEYRAMGTVSGERLPGGLVQGDRIDPIFTPATKVETGHDENVSVATMTEAIGSELAGELQRRSLDVYHEAAAYAQSKGLILADTKFEWGHDVKTGELMLIDEVLTPDSSRYWDASTYKPGGPQPSFDKQFVRDWLESTGWDKASPPPELPDEVVAKTRAKYIEAYKILTGHVFPWK